jgi:hypothetical protein
MKGRVAIWIVVVLILLALLLLISNSKPLKFNWGVNFETDRQPYDVDLLKKILSAGNGTQFRETDIPFHRWMDESYEKGSNYVFCGFNFAPDSIDANSLLDFVSYGNNAIVSSQHFGQEFISSLEEYGGFELPEFKYQSDSNYLVSCLTANDTLHYSLNYFGPEKNKYPFNFQFIKPNDSCPTFINNGWDEKGNLTFFTVAMGDGRLTVHLTPMLLTNYHLKNSTAERFAEAIFSVDKNSKVIWENRRSVVAENNSSNAGGRNPFVYIFSQTSLKWAFVLLMLGVLVFLIFASKRKQTAIHIFVHPENTTLRFLKNMEELHKLYPNFSNMARSRYLYFMNWLQKNYLIERSELHKAGFQTRMQSLCKWESNDIVLFVSNLKRLEANEPFSEIMLYHISLQFERFYKGKN